MSLALNSITLHRGVTVDRERGVISGAAVITSGPTKPSGGGHGSFTIDDVTLRQVASAINVNGGVKCRQTHTEISGIDDDLPHRVGRVVNAEVRGQSVVADIVFYDCESSDARRLMAIAEQTPAELGLSIVTTDSHFETISGQQVLRVASLDSVDLVGDPAANPNGLLAASASSATHMKKEAIMPAIKVRTTGTDRAWSDSRDALLIAMQVPLLELDANGRVALNMHGRPQRRHASQQAIALASEPLLEQAAGYFRNIHGEHNIDLFDSRLPSRLALFSRAKLARHFSGVIHHGSEEPAGVALAGATGDYPGILADSLNKAISTHFIMARRSWRAWARAGTVRDFKQADRIRLVDRGRLDQVDEGQNIEFAKLTEAGSENFTLASFGNGYRLTRQTIVNDDVAAFAGLAESLGQAAARTEDILAVDVLTANADMADGSPLFSTAHVNLTSGTLTTTNLSTARAAMRNQTGSDGVKLDVQPAVLLVPAALESQAEAVLDSTANVRRDDPALRLATTPYLDSDSAAQWYVLGDPERNPAVEVATLNGQTEPLISTKGSFENDGFLIKARHDIAAKAIDWRPIVRSSGA